MDSRLRRGGSVVNLLDLAGYPELDVRFGNLHVRLLVAFGWS
jgi:hypothetical protein